MENTSDRSKEHKKENLFKKMIIPAVNVIIVLIVVLASVNYFSKQLEYRYDVARDNFSATTDTMEQVAYGYLRSEQSFCNNWANYITKNTMSMDQAIDFVCNVNTDENVMAHIIYYDTLEGYSTYGGEEGEKFPVSYKDAMAFPEGFVDEIANCTIQGLHPHITNNYENPVTGKRALGFCHNVTLSEDGKDVNAMLIRIVHVEELKKQWLFPVGYDDASLAMITNSGRFVIRPNSVEEFNFFELVKTNNNLSDAEVQSLKNEVALNQRGIVRYLSSEGKDAYYSYCRMSFNDEWVLVGFIEREDLNVTPVDLTIVAIVIIGFILLMVFDGVYILLMNRRLKVSMEETRRANNAKTRFLSSMSHDIRTPMNAIIGMTNIAQKRIDDKVQVEECLHQIDLASNHLLTLVNDILDISKVESGKLSLNPMTFSLAEVMGNLISIGQPHVKEKAINFNVHVYNIIQEYVYADELRLNQIFINLMSNAVKYTDPGGTVSMSMEERPSEKGENMIQLVFVVSDTGIGISEEYMKSMYNAFSRSADARVNFTQGSGLGLAISKQLIDLMDGTIDVQSEVGKGTTFTVTVDLPIAEKPKENIMLPPMKLLVVDDDEVFLKSASVTLDSIGVTTETVTNGSDAVQMITERHEKGDDYPCVIIDWKMPIMDGLETTRAIRKKVGGKVPIIIITSYDWTDIEEDAIRAGANGFLAKPLFPSTAYKKINELLCLDDDAQTVNEDTGEDLRGLNLLIAEDNDINWDIIQIMLDFSGISATRAENGQICVDMINEAPEGTYQAILMDIQMPVMNGKDAARTIRASDKEYVKNIPIIAMTADAFAEDISACMEAGMNGHVAKPLEMKKLIAALRKALNMEE